MKRKLIRYALAGGAAGGLALALTVPAAAAGDTPLSAPADHAAPAAAPVPDDALPAGMLSAMERDLGISSEQAHERLAREHGAAALEQRLRDTLGDAFAGAWFDADAGLVVAVSDPAYAGTVQTAGAVATTVAHSAQQLAQVQAQLDERADAAPARVTGWHVDVAANTVVVTAHPTAVAAAERFVAGSGVDAEVVEVRASTEQPRTLYDVRGGDAYYPGSSRCSVGFAVEGGFVTAGHCGGVGTSTSGFNQAAQGTVQGSTFPGRDYGWVSVNSSWTPTPLVNRYSGGQTVTVEGSQEAAIGASVCRSGSTTGWHCGTITGKNQTVNYPQGTVQGLTQTTACAEPGDSGGSWLSGQQAQGVTSGGSGNCSSGGTTFFQPLQPILSAYGLTLVTDDGGTPPSPTPTPTTPPPGGGDEWQPGTWYERGTEVEYNGQVYECRQSHTSQPGWEPPAVPALWLQR